MRRKIFGSITVAIIVLVTSVNINLSTAKDEGSLSSLTLENIAALANPEIIDPNTSYGFRMVDCLNDKKQIIGQQCVRGDHTDECKLKNQNGKC